MRFVVSWLNSSGVWQQVADVDNEPEARADAAPLMTQNQTVDAWVQDDAGAWSLQRWSTAAGNDAIAGPSQPSRRWSPNWKALGVAALGAAIGGAIGGGVQAARHEGYATGILLGAALGGIVGAGVAPGRSA